MLSCIEEWKYKDTEQVHADHLQQEEYIEDIYCMAWL